MKLRFANKKTKSKPAKQESMLPYLVADVGGTHARIGVMATGDGHDISDCKTYKCADLSDIQALLKAYRDHLGTALPRNACIAVAGPVHNDIVQLTNLDWQFSTADLAKQFDLDNLEVINDFVAVAWAAVTLRPEKVAIVKPGTPDSEAQRVVLGAGTGLGVAGLMSVDGKWLPIASEGGHARLGPATELEDELFRRIRQQVDHVSSETLLCGSGIVRLYHALADVHGRQSDSYRPEDITRLGLSGDDPLCHQTVQLFCGLLGAVAGDLALLFGAAGGVYIAGDIIRAIQPALAASDFAARFCNKGSMRDYLSQVPVYLIVADEPGLIGAAAWFESRTQQDTAAVR